MKLIFKLGRENEPDLLRVLLSISKRLGIQLKETRHFERKHINRSDYESNLEQFSTKC